MRKIITSVIVLSALLAGTGVAAALPPGGTFVDDDGNVLLHFNKGAKGVLINITGGYDLTLFELDEAANRIREEVASVLAGFGHGEGHVFNLGHGITPDVNPDHLAVLIDAVRKFSPPLHLER